MRVAVVCFLLIALQPAWSQETEPESPNLRRVIQRIADRTNAFRREQDLPPLEVNTQLAETAQHFAHFMAENEEYGHEADGRTPAERAKEHGYDYCLVLENIAYAYDSEGFTAKRLTSSFVDGWIDSPGHRKNLLHPHITETGVGVALGEDGYFYAVQMFGRPQSLAIEFEIKNESGQVVKYTVGDREYEIEPRYRTFHTRCTPTKLIFALDEEAEDGTVTCRPKNGDRIVIVKSDGKLVLKNERGDEEPAASCRAN